MHENQHSLKRLKHRQVLVAVEVSAGSTVSDLGSDHLQESDAIQ